jgi:MSHA biogenesis protein MshJ
LPQHFYWQTLHYQVDKYPQGTVEVILYTLGDSKEFIRG